MRRALAELREVGEELRGRPVASLLEVLGDVLEAFRSPDAPARKQLEAELPEATGFAPATLREGLDAALAHWTRGALRRLVEDELGPELGVGCRRRATGFPVTATLLAGALPTPTLLALLAPLALRSPVLAKCSVHDPCTARIFAQTLSERDASLGRALRVLDLRREDEAAVAALLEADCVVASGSDETLARVAAHVTPPRRLVGYGHRLSVAVLGPAALSGPPLQAAARALARDVALWDQLGCLSPVALFVLCGSDALPPQVATELAAALA